MAHPPNAADDLQNSVQEKLNALLIETGMVDRTAIQREIRDNDGPDFVMEIFTRTGSRLLLVNTRSSGEPRLARQAVNHLLVQQNRWSHACPIFAAPYISEQAAQICQKHQVGYMDLAGNCKIAIDGLFMHTQGRPNPFTSKRRLKSLTRPKAARILRVLLHHPRRHWKARELAAEAGVSLGLVSNVKQILMDREWIDNKRQQIILARPGEILKHLATVPGPQEQVCFFYTPADFLRTENALAEHCRQKGLQFAFTGFSAAVHLASGIDYYRQVQARIHGRAELTADELEFEKTGAKDANVAVIQSTDAGVFYGMRTIQPTSRLQYCRPSEKTVADIEKDIRVPIAGVSPVQVYLDLRAGFAGGDKEAEKILQQVLEPSW